MATSLRMLAVDMVNQANSGHPGMPLGMADVATVLFSKFLNFYPQNPHWINRDRFVLSAGHGSALLYAALHLTGYDLTLDDLKQFRTLNSKTPGHPEYGHTPGVDATTGPLGQGLAMTVGMALAQEIGQAHYGINVFDHKTYVIASDGDLMEGISHEAASLAGHLRLKNLIVLYDDNDITIDGPTSLCSSDDTLKRFESYQWCATRIDGHDPEQIEQAIAQATANNKPTLIACKTKIGYGASAVEGTHKAHGSPLGLDGRNQLAQNLNWKYEPFHIPDDIKKLWEDCAQRGNKKYQQWQKNFKQTPSFKNNLSPSILFGNDFTLETKQKLANMDSKATRQYSQDCLDAIFETLANTQINNNQPPLLVGGSSDLTPSNNTLPNKQKTISADFYSGSYIHYGIREHAMAACMNGLSLHGLVRTYGGTFLVFSDYMRPAIRLSALMKQPVIYVLTHDSIGLGEDGPTHQPIEHLNSLRSIPNLNVFRPADGVETFECWQIALQSAQRPSVIALSRQNVTPFREQPSLENLSLRGAYEITSSSNGYADNLQVTLIATGSEVGLALDVFKMLENNSINAHVISMPCWTLFCEQNDNYKSGVLPKHTLKVAIEAGSSMGWHQFIGENGLIIGLDNFGASAKLDDLYKNFCFTTQHIYEQILNKLSI